MINKEKEQMREILSKDASLVINKKLLHRIGINGTILLSDLMSKEKYFEIKGRLENEWFFNTHKNICKDTTLSEYQQNKAIDILINIGVIETRYCKQSQRLFFKINYSILLKTYDDSIASPPKKLNPPRNLGTPPRNLGLNNNNKNNNKRNNISLSKERERRSIGAELADRVLVENKVIHSTGLKIKRLKPYLFTKNPDVEEIFTYWNQLGKPLPKHKINTSSKTFTKACKQIEKILKTYSKETITGSMQLYFDMINMPGFKLSHNGSGVIVNLKDFLLIGDNLRLRMCQYHKELTITSWFHECRKLGAAGLKEKYSKVIIDENPKITEALKRKWSNVIEKRSQFTAEEENIFRKTAKALYNYFIDLKDFKQDHIYQKENPITCVSLVIKTMAAKNKNDGTIPFWLSSASFFENDVTAYLKKIGYIEHGYDKSIARRKIHDQQNHSDLPTFEELGIDIF
jgi:hypothetical protein